MRKLLILTLGACVSTAILGITPTTLQAAQCATNYPECTPASGVVCEVVETKAPATVKRVVPNGTEVVLAVRKQPNEVCSLDLQREEAKPEPEPISSWLALLVKAVSPAGAIDCGGQLDQNTPAKPEAIQIEGRVRTLETHMQQAEAEVTTRAADFTSLLENTNNLALCINVQTQCATTSAYQTAVDNQSQKLRGAVDSPLPTVSGLETQLAHLQDLLKETEKYQPTAGDTFLGWIASAYDATGCLSGRVSALKERISSMATQRDAAAKALAAFSGLSIKDVKTFSLVRDEDSKLGGTITCKNFLTGTQTMRPIPVSITYRGLPWFTMSVGVLSSEVDKVKIGSQPVRTGDATFNVVVTEDRSGSQLVPFSFLNGRIWTWMPETAPLVAGVSLGVGLNSGTGNREVEYFLGPFLSYRNLALHIGVHRGRVAKPAGGYSVGDLLPAEKFPGVPVTRGWDNGLSIGISYKLPLN